MMHRRDLSPFLPTGVGPDSEIVGSLNQLWYIYIIELECSNNSIIYPQLI